MYSSPPMMTRTAFLVVVISRVPSALLLQEREPAGQGAQPFLGGIDSLPQRLVLGLQLDYPLRETG